MNPCDEILDGVYLGGVPALIHGPKTAAIINLCREQPYQPPQDTTKAYLWLPIDDQPPFPGVGWLNTAVEFVEACRERDWTVLMHCAAGISRSGMVAIAYVMKTYKVGFRKAWAMVREKRPCVHPNAAFMAGLVQYEEWLARRRGDYTP